MLASCSSADDAFHPSELTPTSPPNDDDVGITPTHDAGAVDAEHDDARASDAPLAEVDSGATTVDALSDARDPLDTGPTADPCAAAHDRIVDVATAAALTSALSAATPGTRIVLADGSYKGTFTLAASGTIDKPIALCGSRAAILDGGGTSGGYVLHLNKASHVVVSGLTLTNAGKGLVLDGSSDDLLIGIDVHGIGEEGVHLRAGSSRNVLRDSLVHDTGLVSPGFGEGVYIGSALSHWADFTGSSTTPDKCDQNKVLATTIGPNVGAEEIDVKEGTTGGEIRGNTFDGKGMSGANFADSWMDVKGNGYVIEGNHGQDSLNDGFQTHVVLAGWGNDNVFRANVAKVNGPGYGVRVDPKSTGTIVGCDDVVTGAALGASNVKCAP